MLSQHSFAEKEERKSPPVNTGRRNAHIKSQERPQFWDRFTRGISDEVTSLEKVWHALSHEASKAVFEN